MTTPAIMSNPIANPEQQADPHGEYRKLLSHPRVMEFLQKSLEAYENLQAADRRDLEQQAMDALWKRRLDADPPGNLPRLIALARKVLDGKLADFFRRREVERSRIADPPKLEREDGREGAPAGKDQPNFVEEVAPPRPVNPQDLQETAEQLAFVQEKIADGTLTLDDIEVMQAEYAGDKTLDALAVERGLKPATLRKRLQRVRDKLSKEWNIRSTRMLMLVILMLLLLVAFAVAMAGRSDPPPPQRPDRTLDRASQRRAAPELPAAPDDGRKTPPR